MIKHLRAYETRQKRPGNPVATWMADHFSTVHRLVNLGLGTAKLAGNLLPFQKLWIWDRHMPRPIPKKQLAAATAPVDSIAIEDHPLKVVYFPSCINQSMGSSVRDGEKRPLVQITREVLEKAGYQILYPEDMGSLCCGTPWESKGFFELADAKSSQLEEALLKVSDQGSIPVLCDTSPCTYRMKRVMSDKLDLYEPVEFIHDHLLNKLKLKRRTEKIAFHVTCTSTKMGLQEKFEKVAKACTEEALFPEEVGCCGFAGDKGFTQPKINSWALRNLKLQVKDQQAGFSNSRTCEIGLSRNSGINYKSIMYLLHSSME
jgi:D-lactate dehydrogenase